MVNLAIQNGLDTQYSQVLWNPADANNFTLSKQGVGDVSYVVLHSMFGSLDGTVPWFENPTSNVSAHYFAGRNGQLVQMVREQDIAWHAGNWPINQQSVGIELEALQRYLARPWATESMYQASAALVRYITEKYKTPKTRANIIGHNEVPGSSKRDPGNYWGYFTELVQGVGQPSPTASAAVSATAIPTATPIPVPTATAIPTPAPTHVPSYVLRINGNAVQPGQTVMSIPHGTITISLPPNTNGSYLTNIVIALAANLDQAGFHVIWGGVDRRRGAIATVEISVPARSV